MTAQSAHLQAAQPAARPAPASRVAAAPMARAACLPADPMAGMRQSGGPSHATLIQLQRVHGNRAVQRMVAAAAPAVAPAPPARGTKDDSKDDAPGGTPWWQAVAFGESVAWTLMGQVAPELTPIVRAGPQGIAEWLRSRAGGAASSLLQHALQPFNAAAGLGAQLTGWFKPLLATLGDAAGKIAANDCKPLSDAAERIEQAATRILTPIVEKLQPVLAMVQDALSAAWAHVGAPIWGWIQQYAGQQWDLLKQLASWLWAFTEPMRTLGGDAWTWVKNKIGIGEGPEGENGVLQWLQGKLETAWEWVKAQLAPFAKQMALVQAALAQAAAVVTAPVAQAAALAAQAGPGLRWIAANLGRGDALVKARAHAEKAVIAPLDAALGGAAAAVTGVAASIQGALARVAAGIDQAAGALAGTPLQAATAGLRWLAAEAHAAALWAGQSLAGAAAALASAVARLRGFLARVVQLLRRLQVAAADVWKLPLLLAEGVWNAVPACIRDPVVDFLMPIILRQVELFEELVRDNAAWQKTKAQVLAIVRKVFVNGDLMGAVKDTFALLLRTFNIPPEMLQKVAAKAAAAWDVVVRKPIEFIKNTVRSLGHGFKLLWQNIGTHLEHGIEGWLFGELQGKDIHPPSSWTEPKEILGFVVDVLGLSTSHVVQLMKQRIDPGLVDGAQAWIGRFQRAWAWINDAIKTSRSPAENVRGLVDKARDFGKGILKGAVEWIAGKVAAELAMLASAAAASGGLSEVIDVARRIYKAMLTAKRWAGQILQMANQTLDHVLDIASGNVAKVGGEFEKVMDRGMPVVIGFLADQVGLGGVGPAIRGIVDKLREKVDAAILWLIDKIKAGLGAVLGALKSGAAAVAGWLGLSERFTVRGEPHRVFFEGSGESAELMVASRKSKMEKLLEENGELHREVKRRSPAHMQAFDRACSVFARIQAAQRTLSRRPEDADALAAIVQALPRLTKELGFIGVDVVGTIPLQVGEVVQVWTRVGPTSTENRWVVSRVTSIDIEGRSFKCCSTNLKVAKEEMRLYFDDIDKTWKAGDMALVLLSEEALERENMEDSWDTADTARRVLNYRRSGSQHQTRGDEWEHIMEQATGLSGKSLHFAKNMAYTTNAINRALNEFCAEPHAAHPGDNLGGTNNLPLRKHLKNKGAGLDEWKSWKKRLWDEKGWKLTEETGHGGKRWQKLG
jgi:hypothetical protein